MGEKDNSGLELKVRDEQTLDEFFDGKSDKFDYAAFSRRVIYELQTHNAFTENSVLGFKRCEIIKMIECPERNRKRILKLSDFMYLKSGYYKRLIDYFVNQIMINYTVDTNINDIRAYKNSDKIKTNYIRFCRQADKFNLRNVAHEIFKRMFKNDVCFAFVIDDIDSCKYFFLDPMICEIKAIANGKVYQFCINARSRVLNERMLATFPEPLQELIKADVNNDGKIIIPIANSLCLKYNTDFSFAYPPFLMMIADILLIDDYKDLAKTQSVNDAYKLLALKIPTKDGQMTLDGKLIEPFVKQVLQVVQSNLGVICTPFDTSTEEFSTSNADNRDNVSNAISWAFKDVGVSESLMSGATSGSELKLSITNDSGDIFRLYRHMENWVDLQMYVRGLSNPSNYYSFVYRILNMTTFNESDVRDKALKEAQNGLPNKFELEATRGKSPCSVMGNTLIENVLFDELFNSWTPLKTSYTQTGEESESGRPESDDGDLSASGEVTRENDTNDKDNRI